MSQMSSLDIDRQVIQTVKEQTKMNKSELYKALAKAQGEMQNADLNKVNPHFKAKYADLASVMSVVKKPLADNGLAIIQMPIRSEPGTCAVRTILAHESGAEIVEDYSMPVAKETAHAFGSVISYIRRYVISSICCVVADEDDDANSAVASEPVRKKPVNDSFMELKNASENARVVRTAKKTADSQ